MQYSLRSCHGYRIFVVMVTKIHKVYYLSYLKTLALSFKQNTNSGPPGRSPDKIQVIGSLVVGLRLLPRLRSILLASYILWGCMRL